MLIRVGAGEENRTPVCSLGSQRFTEHPYWQLLFCCYFSALTRSKKDSNDFCPISAGFVGAEMNIGLRVGMGNRVKPGVHPASANQT